MRILIEAYSCEPGEGSEKGVGWHTVCQLTSEFQHDLVVITRAANREAIEGSGDLRARRVKWIFVDPPKLYDRIKRRGGLGLRVYNMVWQREMRKAALEFLKENEVDVLHRLTFGSIVPPTLLAKLGLPLVVGPAGGAEMSPRRLLKGFPLRHRVKDSLRAILFRVVTCLPASKRAYQDCAVALGATDVSVKALQKLGVQDVRLVPQSGCGSDEVEEFARLNADGESAPTGAVRIVTASRLIHWKAVSLAIDAVHAAVQNGVDVELDILESGPERKTLEKMVSAYGLQNRVKFLGRLPSLQDVYTKIRESDALIHPALNEAFGQVVLESLALGRQVICLDWAGPGMIVTKECGIKIDPGTREQVVCAFAEAIAALAERRGRWAELQEAAVARSNFFSWKRLVTQVDRAYRDAVT